MAGSRRVACRGLVVAVALTASLAATTRAQLPVAASGMVSVPHITIHQSRGLDCVAAALVMALSSRGLRVTEDWVMAQMPDDTRPAVVSGGQVVQWGDPYQGFVGKYFGSEPALTGYGVYWPPIAAAARAAGAPAEGLEGWNPVALYDEVLAGHAAVVWVENSFSTARTRYWTAWESRVVPYAVVEHAVALVGVDPGAGTVLVADPWVGQDRVVPMARFQAAFAVFGNMAVVIGGGGGMAISPTPSGGGYRIGGPDGSVAAFGDAAPLPDLVGWRLNRGVVGMASTPTGNGYWLVASDGGIFPFGDAVGYGSTGGLRLNRPIVGIAATPHGNGYWLVAADGGIFPFGDAGGYGSAGGIRLNRPIVGIAATPSGHGYWLVASDGGIFPFGDAGGYGSTGGIHLNQPIVAMAATPGGHGYWLAAADGGIFPFGDAGGFGSTGGIRLNQPIVAMAATPSAHGYWLLARDGGVFPFGDAPGLGSTA
ncbi:MAG TPA: C39 family peptidase [Candidatus Dormibacteraeota bacterium]